MRGIGEREAQTHDQVLVLIHELIAEFDLEKKFGCGQSAGRTGLFMLASLQ